MVRKHLTDVGLQKCDIIRVKHNEVWKFEIIMQQYFTRLSPVWSQIHELRTYQEAIFK